MDVFGELRSGGAGVGANEWLFTGEQRDPQTGRNLYYLRARFYDPRTGRFLGRDPARAGHPYGYAGNNPLIYVDPYGLFGCGPFGGVCDKVSDAFECPLNAFDCVDPRRGTDALIGLVPAGTITIPLIGQSISYREAAACAAYPGECAIVGLHAASADLLTRKIYHGEPPEGTPGDAFQHCFWSGSMALDLGSARAEKWTNWHEAKADNPSQQREFDLQNNRRGREIAQSLRLDPLAHVKLINRCQGLAGRKE